MINWSTLSDAEKTEALSRPAMADSESLRNTVAGILADVTARGDDAVLEYTRKFDCPSLEALQLSTAARDTLAEQVTAEVQDAIKTAFNNVNSFTRRSTQKIFASPLHPVLYVNSALPASKPLACISQVAVRHYHQPS